MPKKKAVPDPASEQEMEPVSAVESAEDPSAAEAGMAEVAAPLPDADAAVAPLEEGAPKPDAPVQATEDPPADGQDMAPEQEVGGVMELDAGEETAPEILGLEPGPSPDAEDRIDGDMPVPEEPAAPPDREPCPAETASAPETPAASGKEIDPESSTTITMEER